MPPLIVKEPKVIIMDMLGTAIKVGFIEKILIPYAKDNVVAYVEEKWADKRFKKDVEKLRKESDKGELSVKIAAANAPEAEQKQSIVSYVLAAMEAKKETSGLQIFRFNIWFDGYKKKKITTPIYSDVAIQIKKWKDMNIKLYVLSNGWKEANKKFLSATSHGDLNLMLDGHFDSGDGALDNKDTYVKVVAKIGNPVEECLFLTKSGAEGLAAKAAGMSCVLVLTHRKNIDKLGEQEKALPRIRTFNELEFGEPPPPAQPSQESVPAAGTAPEGQPEPEQGAGGGAG